MLKINRTWLSIHCFVLFITWHVIYWVTYTLQRKLHINHSNNSLSCHANYWFCHCIRSKASSYLPFLSSLHHPCCSYVPVLPYFLTLLPTYACNIWAAFSMWVWQNLTFNYVRWQKIIHSSTLSKGCYLGVITGQIAHVHVFGRPEDSCKPRKNPQWKEWWQHHTRA